VVTSRTGGLGATHDATVEAHRVVGTDGNMRPRPTVRTALVAVLALHIAQRAATRTPNRVPPALRARKDLDAFVLGVLGDAEPLHRAVALAIVVCPSYQAQLTCAKGIELDRVARRRPSSGSSVGVKPCSR
jgi:hypothetical protein